MWCPGCQAEVAAQVASESGKVTCAVCAIEISSISDIHDPARNAREILRRWTQPGANNMAYGPAIEDPRTVRPTSSRTARVDSKSSAVRQSRQGKQETTESDEHDSDRPKRNLRIAPNQSLNDIPPTRRRERTQRPPTTRRVDAAGHGVRRPHFPITPISKRGNFGVVAGQWLAYIGVLGLTVGTATVVYGYFGGITEYTSTGWLITTFGQMLLFLGVSNLVSGGMEQSNDEVNQRIEMLGEHIIRIEQATTSDGLRGPKIPAERFANPGAASARTRDRETVGESSESSTAD